MFRNNVRTEREKQGISQRELAERIHMAAPLLSDIERGVRRVWPRAAGKLATALHTDISNLFPVEVQNAE